MVMTVKKTKDRSGRTVFMSNNGKIADSPMGASIKASELVNGSLLLDGTAVGRASSGIVPVCKSAKALTGSTATEILVSTDSNQFIIGEKIFSLLAGKHYAITGVDPNGDGTTTITVGTAIDAPLTNGGFIYQNADVADGATGAALLVDPYAITGTAVNVDTTSNIHCDIWVQTAVKKDMIGSVIVDAIRENGSVISEL